MKMPFDAVVISSDTNPKFLDFWPYVYRAWTRLYPDVQFKLVVVSDDPKKAPYPALCLKPVPDIPVPNQAKLARYWVAANQRFDLVCSLNDIDLIPISKTYIDDFLANRPRGFLVRMGAEFYTGPELGKATSGYLTAESGVWRTLVNPHGLDWEPWICQFVGFKVFDDKEDISNPAYYENPDCFSDESWLRAMLARHPIPRQDRVRGYHCYTERALCRSNWKFDGELIRDGTIVEAHLPRPFSEHRDKLDPLFKLLGIL